MTTAEGPDSDKGKRHSRPDLDKSARSGEGDARLATPTHPVSRESCLGSAPNQLTTLQQPKVVQLLQKREITSVRVGGRQRSVTPHRKGSDYLPALLDVDDNGATTKANGKFYVYL